MKERPLIFTGESVRAIHDGRKTQTRRVLKNGFMDLDKTCPYGQVGDRLWVRETFCYVTDPFEATCGIYYKIDGKIKRVDSFPNETHVWNHCAERFPGCVKWKPSIFMPRWASRIDLEITNIRTERLQEISEEDAIEEGARPPMDFGATSEFDQASDTACTSAFINGWDFLNAKRGYSWESNPWVRVIEFKVIKPEVT